MKWYIVVGWSCLFGCTALSQPVIDSLERVLDRTDNSREQIDVLTKLSQEYVNSDREKGTRYAQKAIGLATKIGDRKGLAEAYRCLAVNMDSDGALQYFTKALNLAKEVKARKTEGTIYRNIAVFYIYRSNYPKGLEYSFHALRISEELKNNEEIAGNLLNIGFIYNDLQNTEKALYYFQRALDKNKTFDNPMMKAVILENLGVIYNNTGEYRKAIPFLEKARKVYEEKGNLNFMATTLGTLGSCYLNLRQYDKAEAYLKEALRLSRLMDINRTMSANLNNLAAVHVDRYGDVTAKGYYRDPKLLQQALVLLKEATVYDREGNDLKALSENLREISEVYEEQQRPDSALAYYKQQAELRDSIFRTENKETVKNLEDQRAIELRDKQIEWGSLALEAREKQKWLLIAGLAFVVAAGGLFFYQSRKRKKMNEVLRELNTELDLANRTKTRFFSILNHDLRSPVANLIHFLHLQQESPELLSEGTRERLEARTITTAENLLETMEDLLLWSKGQMENFQPRPRIVALRDLLEDTEKHFAGHEAIAIRFENPENIQVLTDEDYLKTIIRNLTGNAIKVLEGMEMPVITWKAWTKNGKSHLAIADNGPGGTPEQFRALYDPTEVVGIRTGLGMHLIRDLAKAIDCAIVVDTAPESGTTVTLVLN
jgi:signal transduction histidine kinase/Tfp pilus assembly protein PilF